MADGIQLKTRGELQAMRASGLVLARALDAVRAQIAPGVTTAQLDDVVAAVIAEAGATPNFKGYHGYPATICTSVNDEVVHGIPSARVLADGDLLSVDAGCILDGWHSDSAFSVHVGAPSDESETAAAEVDMINAAWRSLWAGVAAAKAGGRLGDVSFAIEQSVNKSGADDGRRYGSVSGYGGHGIGTEMHMDPFVANQGKRGRGAKLVPGMALAIEPMLTLGRPATKELDDGWTVVTRDGARAAHVEHSIAITSDGVSVLTAPDRGAAELAAFDIEPVDLDG
ncbi:type I methionyl aminopeptidase [Nakamurella lactea]|uniref:type I methionyl aminopeptidase n=1 Tax=Nakamurella lactea TaxID=459515 RepID=UPI0004236AF7|nr:type I methionyl aminopeptidase [Nakamurella lactea]